jgi:hypothetical protein
MPLAACRTIPDHSSLAKPNSSPQTLTLVTTPVRFDAAFIEQRMRQHQARQMAEAEFLAAQIVREVEAVILGKLQRAREACREL